MAAGGLLYNVLNNAVGYVGTPYVWGGASPQGFDCSGLVQYVYGAAGVNLPRVANDQIHAGTPVNAKDAQPGDLIGFDNNSSEPGIDHIGIYLGNGLMLQAPHSGANVQVVRVNLKGATAISRPKGLPANAYAGLDQQGGSYVFHAAATSGATPPTAISAQNGGGDVATKPVTDQQIRDYVTSHYGYAASYLRDPEIGPILLDAAKRGLGQDELLGKLQATKWWKTHSNSQIKWDNLSETNPGEAKAQVAAQMSSIGAAAKQRGINLTQLQIHDLAVLNLRNGWNADQLNNAMMYQAKVDPTVVKANYGPYVALGQTNPEIQKVVQQAVSGQWSQAQFDAAIQNTQWFKTTAPSARDAATTQANDPSKATADQKVIHDKVVAAARNLGVPDSDPRVNQLGVDAYINGMSDADIQRKLADMVKVDPTGQANTGQTAVTVDSLKQQASQYLVPLSDDVLSKWVDQIQRGDVPAASFDAYLKAQAKSLFPSMGAAIDKGITPSQYLDPYKSYAASILERPADSIDFLNDPKFSKAVFQVDPKTGERTAMSLSDWQTYLRGLPDYQQTAQAKDQAAQFGEQIAQTFGKVAY